MTGSLSWITDDGWPSDEGWPYPDADADLDVVEDGADLDADPDVDVDRISLLVTGSRLFDDLGPVERSVIVGRYGLDGTTPRTMRDLQQELHLPRAELKVALGSGLTKLRGRIG